VRAPTELRDSNGILFGLRPFPHHLMTREFMVRLMRRVDTLALAVGAALPRKPHTRGEFAQILLGYKHGMGNAENVRMPVLFSLTTAHNASKVYISHFLAF
jgi:hypothetical protein